MREHGNRHGTVASASGLKVSATPPLRDISCQVAGCVRISSSALPSSRSLVGSTVTPWCSVFMMSTGPPFLVATVGTPCAAACTSHVHCRH